MKALILSLAALVYHRPEQVEIQGVLVGQMRRYHSLQAK